MTILHFFLKENADFAERVLMKNVLKWSGILLLILVSFAGMTSYGFLKNNSFTRLMPLATGITILSMFFVGFCTFCQCEKLFKHRFIGGALFYAGFMSAYPFVMDLFTNQPIAQFFSSGTECTNIFRIMPIERLNSFGDLMESNCYRTRFKTKIEQIKPEERQAYFKKALEIFKQQNRLTATAAGQLLSGETERLIQEKKLAATPELRSEIMYTLLDDVLVVVESVPSDTTKSKSLAKLALSRTKSSFPKLAKEYAARNPASAKISLSHSEKIKDLTERYETLKGRFRFSDRELDEASKIEQPSES